MLLSPSYSWETKIELIKGLTKATEMESDTAEIYIQVHLTPKPSGREEGEPLAPAGLCLKVTVCLTRHDID